MTTPRIEVDLGKIAHNAQTLRRLYDARGISVFGVTKAVCGNPTVAHVLVRAGMETLADSRLQNIERMRQAGVRADFVLLRSPGPSSAQATVTHADISLHTELSTIEQLSLAALEKSTVHKIILMVELGDLREGLMPAELMQVVEQVRKMHGVILAGIGTNLACFGGISPSSENMEQLSSLAGALEDRFGLTLEFVSGGNSANYDWFMAADDIGQINNLRLGESIYLGLETLRRTPIPGLFTDAFTLFAEVIESKVKPSIPHGTVCQDAFGEVPVFEDTGPMRRGLLGLGMQDVLVAGLSPHTDIKVVGASSDHIIVDAGEEELAVGAEVAFGMNYGALLSAMTSPYVMKKTVGQ